MAGGFMKSTIIRRTCALEAVILALAIASLAQDNRATLTGHVTDPNKAAVPGATVTVTNAQTNEQKVTTTTSDGDYTILYLQPGRYNVIVEAQGFKRAASDTVELHTADKATMDISLEVGGLEQTVNVNSDAPLLEPDTGSRGQVVENMRVTELPLNGRN